MKFNEYYNNRKKQELLVESLINSNVLINAFDTLLDIRKNKDLEEGKIAQAIGNFVGTALPMIGMGYLSNIAMQIAGMSAGVENTSQIGTLPGLFAGAMTSYLTGLPKTIGDLFSDASDWFKSYIYRKKDEGDPEYVKNAQKSLASEYMKELFSIKNQLLRSPFSFDSKMNMENIVLFRKWLLEKNQNFTTLMVSVKNAILHGNKILESNPEDESIKDQLEKLKFIKKSIEDLHEFKEKKKQISPEVERLGDYALNLAARSDQEDKEDIAIALTILEKVMKNPDAIKKIASINRSTKEGREEVRKIFNELKEMGILTQEDIDKFFKKYKKESLPEDIKSLRKKIRKEKRKLRNDNIN